MATKKVKFQYQFKLLQVASLVVLAGLLILGTQYFFDTSRQKQDTPEGNLLPNGSFEKVDDHENIADWQVTTTEGLAAKIGQGDGYIGKKDLRVIIDSYQTGFASIQSSEVAINPNQQYFFKAYYLTTLDFDLLVQYRYQDNTTKLVLVHHYPAVDAVWSTMSAVIPPQPNVTAVSAVIHIADSGAIELDGAYLIPSRDLKYPFATQGTVNSIPNPGVEQKTSTGVTASWFSYQDGDKKAGFEVATDNGNYFLRSTVKEYHNGEAKWQYTPIPVAEQHNFYFSVDYRSNTFVDVMAEYTLTDGSKRFSKLATLSPTDQWTSYQSYVETLPKSKDMFIALILSKNGFVDSDNYRLSDITVTAKPFSRPLISLTFDDGWESAYTEALPPLDANQMPATFYINSSTIGDEEFFNSKQLKDILKRGHQLASHGDAHGDITLLSQSRMKKDLQETADFLKKKLGVSTVDIATPFGKHDAQTDNYIASLYASHRGTDAGINTRQNIDLYNLKVLFIRHDSTPQLIQSQINEAKAMNGWLILIYHQVGNGKGNSEVTSEQFKSHIETIRNSGVAVRTVRQAIEEIQSQ